MKLAVIVSQRDAETVFNRPAIGEVCPLSTLADLYQLVKTADRVLTF